MLPTLRAIQFTDVYIKEESPCSATHNSRGHLYSSTFGMDVTTINTALDHLLVDAEGQPLHQRTFAYDILRHCPRSNVKAWKQISTAIAQDLSAAEHVDHTIAALQMFEALPNQILLEMATDSTIEGRMTSVLEHLSPDVRCIAVRCLSGAWLRIWSLLDQGQLRQQLFDEENSLVQCEPRPLPQHPTFQ